MKKTKKNKYKIVNPEDIYCEFCGSKNKLKLRGYFDRKDGRPEAFYGCSNTKCCFGQSSTCTNKGDEEAEGVPFWKSIFTRNTSVCKRC